MVPLGLGAKTSLLISSCTGLTHFQFYSLEFVFYLAGQFWHCIKELEAVEKLVMALRIRFEECPRIYGIQ